jgi:hypothetical protein
VRHEARCGNERLRPSPCGRLSRPSPCVACYLGGREIASIGGLAGFVASLATKVWGGSRTWAGARAQSVLMSVWRTCWQHGRLALDFLSRLLRGPPSQDGAIADLKVWPAETAVALKSCERQRRWPDQRPVLY